MEYNQDNEVIFKINVHSLEELALIKYKGRHYANNDISSLSPKKQANEFNYEYIFNRLNQLTSKNIPEYDNKKQQLKRILDYDSRNIDYNLNKIKRKETVHQKANSDILNKNNEKRFLQLRNELNLCDETENHKSTCKSHTLSFVPNVSSQPSAIRASIINSVSKTKRTTDYSMNNTKSANVYNKILNQKAKGTESSKPTKNLTEKIFANVFDKYNRKHLPHEKPYEAPSSQTQRYISPNTNSVSMIPKSLNNIVSLKSSRISSPQNWKSISHLMKSPRNIAICSNRS